MNYLGSVLQLQKALLESDDKLNVDDLTKHHFADGVYVRELRIPAGNVCIGKMHRFEHLSILLEGTITVATEDGRETISAPHIVKSKPGVKRAGYAVTDTVWLTIHGNPENVEDLAILEDKFIVPETEVLEMSKAKLESKP